MRHPIPLSARVSMEHASLGFPVFARRLPDLDSFALHGALDAGNLFEIDNAHEPIGGGVVGRRHVEIDPHGLGDYRLFMRDSEIEDQFPIGNGETEFGIARGKISPKERVADVRQIQPNMVSRTDRDVEDRSMQPVEKLGQAHLEPLPLREPFSRPLVRLRAESTDPAKHFVPCPQRGRRFIARREAPIGGEVRVPVSKLSVGPSGGFESRFVGMGSPIGNDFIRGGTDIS